MVRIIKTVEDFWQVIDEIRVKKEINWSNLVGGKAQLAASKRWNPPLTDILQMQKKLDVDIINTLVYELTEAEQEVTKDPEVPEKMKLIYQWIQADNWMEDEELLQKVQEVARTIL
ncbi:hypothetical protein UAY_03341 [Enterococcus moraviensis ATCC BAA-383]|uniref:Uncharacterized protein n=1 Tax=Enterococcus moraviensis ATCC BAA-383 TaxID=1158609 RepID=R2SL74_9ENTE|nr:hypothetical protein [Enterococcus moraviensis]EOH95915.1 hypothetical protein UAY_03341 [Enterococcus moraviensis ATCC BAA-383]EOT66402.1 hypothetical protein I586_02673 [Enterococcus moraviensis ATCC BAA-383]